MNFKNKVAILALWFVLFMSLVQNSYAYLDPGTGSYFIQILIAALLGGLFLIKSFWKNLAIASKAVFLKVASCVRRGKKCENK